MIPSVSLAINESGANTTLSAALPATTAVQIAWRTPSKEGHALSRARYRGELRGEAAHERLEQGRVEARAEGQFLGHDLPVPHSPLHHLDRPILRLTHGRRSLTSAIAGLRCHAAPPA